MKKLLFVAAIFLFLNITGCYTVIWSPGWISQLQTKLQIIIPTIRRVTIVALKIMATHMMIVYYSDTLLWTLC